MGIKAEGKAARCKSFSLLLTPLFINQRNMAMQQLQSAEAGVRGLRGN